MFVKLSDGCIVNRDRINWMEAGINGQTPVLLVTLSDGLQMTVEHKSKEDAEQEMMRIASGVEPIG